MTARENYDAIDALNFTNAKRLLVSAKHFKHGAADKEDPDKYVVGTLVHAMVLEGKDLRKSYVIKPKTMSFATKEGKAWKAAQTLPILEEEKDEKIPRMADAIASNRHARYFIETCKMREQIVVSTMGTVKCKSLVDGIGLDSERRLGFIELKSCLDIHVEAFAKQVCSLHYDMQHEFYAANIASSFDLGGSRPWSVWICVENHKPFDVAIHVPSEAMIQSGIAKVEDALNTFTAAQASGRWEGIYSEINVIDPPRYRMKQLYADTEL